ncbi:sodium:proton antiporter [Marinicauda salina]|uniref:Sodium:proton antiporter n=1 Tax=Marinicauda salina TaxID=2135793 RepID=A0A2U2BV41_9PROT|nr:sodium:proton antiporter [Marinicauda salina]
MLTTFGVLLLAGLALDALGRRTRLPRITLLVVFGAIIGPAGFGLLPIDAENWREITADLALTMVAFLLGGELSLASLRRHGRAIVWVSLLVSLVTFAVMTAGLAALGAPIALALALAGVGVATDPAAIRDVVSETRADGPVTRTILGIVAIDDAWAIITFSVLLGVLAAAGDGIAGGFGAGAAEIGKSLAIGAAVGLPASFASGRIRPGEPTLAEALGLVLLCAGVAEWLGASLLLTGMTAGAVIVNLARHHDYSFHEIEHISWPFLIVFFVLAGAGFDPAGLTGALALTGGYLVFRTAGRFLGGWIGGRAGGLDDAQSRRIGLMLTPQAGVALGMALVARDALPSIGDTLLNVAVTTTILFEIAGPIATRILLKRAGETDARD